MKFFPTLFRTQRRYPIRAGFTLIELMTVITIIVILVGLIVGAAGFANNKAARARAQGEITALSAAVENYKSDNGIYPRSSNTDLLDARTQGDPLTKNKTVYNNATRDLYALLTAQVNATTGAPSVSPIYPPPVPTGGVRNYWGDLKPSMLSGLSSTNIVPTAIQDPFGMSYGYSTAYQADLDAATPVVPPKRGYNPSFDLWSVGSKISTDTNAANLDKSVRPAWITNW